ncbi:MAG TPA: PTS glucose transporter subunit IIA [Nocardioidaceae bacterium]|jgi:PTS system N-acetylglucosamine-specific IIA component
MPLKVLSPVSGHSLEVARVPDPVFSRGLVGPGVAVIPHARPQTAVAPITGRLVKLLPHAFVVQSDCGAAAVLVHLGIDTVQMQGEGFTVRAAEDEVVEAGAPIVDWDPGSVQRSGRSAACAVVVLDRDASALGSITVDTDVTTEDTLFEVRC